MDIRLLLMVVNIGQMHKFTCVKQVNINDLKLRAIID